MGKEISIPYVSKDVESLLLWRDVKRSGIVFGGATAVYLFILLNPLPWFTLICYALSVGTLAAFLWAQMGNFVSKSGPPVPAVLTNGLSEDDVRKYGEAVRPLANKVLGVLGVLVSGKDLKLSAMVISGAYSAARIFAVVGPITLGYLVVLLAFTLPKGYELKRDEVDGVVGVARNKLDELYGKFNDAVLSKIPKAGQSYKPKAN